MTEYEINVGELRKYAGILECGDKVYLSGIIYTARDAAHARICSIINEGGILPFEIKDSVIYYAGPTPTKPDGQIGSFGPTTSSRMDAFSPVLLDMGLAAMIGKGNRSEKVNEAIKRNSALYFCAEGGMGALISRSIVSSEEIAFKELGPESVKKLEVKGFPVILAVDARGNSIFNRKQIRG